MDLENRWDIAAPAHLLKELFSGKPTEKQRQVYSLLREAWRDVGRPLAFSDPHEGEIALIEKSLSFLNLKDPQDGRHLAEAIALGASWFLTNDHDILEKVILNSKKRGEAINGLAAKVGAVQGVRVAPPSECVRRLSFDPVFGLIQDV